MDEREKYEAIVEEHGLEGALLVRPDGSQEVVFLRVEKGTKNHLAQLYAEAQDPSKSFKLITNREKLIEHLKVGKVADANNAPEDA